MTTPLVVSVVLLSSLAALPALVWAGYLFVLTLASQRRPPLPPRSEVRFDVVVPAHDEETGIADTVRSLLSVEYPKDRFRVIVVADNCADATASRAAGAGATVLERTDPVHRGKGYALAHAFERSLSDAFADAIVVVDADTTVSPNLLGAFAAHLAAGARAVQAEYGVRNPSSSWRTRLMVIALALFHVLRSVARERLGVSVGLRGNGMCFASSLLREVPHDAFSIVEDVEYGIRIGLRGYRVHFASEARVLGEMVGSEKASRSQRRRWESGRAALARAYRGKLVAAAWAGSRAPSERRIALDLALDVFVPPLATVVGVTLAGLVASAVVARLVGAPRVVAAASAPWALALLLVVVYVARGVVLAGVGPRGIVDLAWAPVYMVWKVGLSLAERTRGGKKGKSTGDAAEWVRTTREAETQSATREGG